MDYLDDESSFSEFVFHFRQEKTPTPKQPTPKPATDRRTPPPKPEVSLADLIPNLLENNLAHRIKKSDHLKSVDDADKLLRLETIEKQELNRQRAKRKQAIKTKGVDSMAATQQIASLDQDALTTDFPLQRLSIFSGRPRPTRKDGQKRVRRIVTPEVESRSEEIDQILENSRFIRKKTMVDKLSGMHAEINTDQNPILIEYDTPVSYTKLNRMKRRLRFKQQASVFDDHHYCEHYRSSTASTTRTGYGAPAHMRVEMEAVMEPRAYSSLEDAYLRSYTNSTIPGKLCRNPFPLTDALHREGTSETKLKYRPLGPGEWNVMKVWPRKLDKVVTPLQMANEDVPKLFRHHNFTASKALSHVQSR